MLELDKGLYDEMVEHGLREFPNEACGLVAGKEGRPVRYFAMTNADASPATYRLDPVEHHRVHT
ncbi:MAG: Mov34/MPN/PAD-1 family protein, partial [Actinomycetota bacterium]